MAKLSLEQKKYVVDQLMQGVSVSELSSELNLTWHQVKYWKDAYARVAKSVDAPDLKSVAAWRTGSSPVSRTQYAYLLGMYLGNGYVNKQGKYTWKLRITLPASNSGIVEQVIRAMEALLLHPNVIRPDRSTVVEVYAYGQVIAEMFPQHGSGLKHARSMVLSDWQQSIVNDHRIEFLLGLHHSDGSRFTVTSTGRVQYNFTNTSRDIVNMYCSVLEAEGVRYNTYVLPAHDNEHERITVTICRKVDVEWCEHMLGPKA